MHDYHLMILVAEDFHDERGVNFESALMEILIVLITKVSHVKMQR